MNDYLCSLYTIHCFLIRDLVSLQKKCSFFLDSLISKNFLTPVCLAWFQLTTPLTIILQISLITELIFVDTPEPIFKICIPSFFSC